MLVVDSRAREAGGSIDAFQIRIAPAIESVHGVGLLYASIANPDDETAERAHSQIRSPYQIRGELGLGDLYNSREPSY